MNAEISRKTKILLYILLMYINSSTFYLNVKNDFLVTKTNHLMWIACIQHWKYYDILNVVWEILCTTAAPATSKPFQKILSKILLISRKIILILPTIISHRKQKFRIPGILITILAMIMMTIMIWRTYLPCLLRNPQIQTRRLKTIRILCTVML